MIIGCAWQAERLRYREVVALFQMGMVLRAAVAGTC
jgi:hypothetical protein